MLRRLKQAVHAAQGAKSVDERLAALERLLPESLTLLEQLENGRELEKRRREAARLAFHEFDFGSYVDVHHYEWEHFITEPEWVCEVTCDNYADSDTYAFVVRFKDGSDEIEKVFVREWGEGN